MSEWSTGDQKNLVVFAPEILRIFDKYRQQYLWQPESGGILLGRRRGKHLEVLLATEPSHKDTRLPFSFIREPEGHAEVAELAWLQSGGQIDYLGEWHTHPQRVPIPSATDRHEWGKLVLDRPPSPPLLVVVVGTDVLHCELIDRVQNKVLGPVG